LVTLALVPPPEEAELEALLLGFGVALEVDFAVEPEVVVVFFFLVVFFAAAVVLALLELLALAVLEAPVELELFEAAVLLEAELFAEPLLLDEAEVELVEVVFRPPAEKVEPVAELAPIA
jgi:hypothetical protein